MSSGSYFFDDGQARKFWSYSLDGRKRTIRSGRLGTNGRQSTKTFRSASEAEAATEKLVARKIAEGYIQVDAGRLKITRPKGESAATETQVAQLEKEIGAELPAEYREFLLMQNGGQPDPEEIIIPVLADHGPIPVGFIYGLYARPEPFQSLQFALEDIRPHLPDGQLPVAGPFNLYYYSISLDRHRGCVYYWDEDAGDYEVDEGGEAVFDSSHAVLVAGSFNEFLTRIAAGETADQAEEPVVPPAGDQVATKQEAARGRKSESRDKSPLSEERQEGILRLTREGGDELTAAIEQGDRATARFLLQMKREIRDFLKTTTDRYELQLFADNWHWDANTRPMLELVRNPHADAGTLLQVFWHAGAEDYYLFYRTVAEIEDEFEKYVFRVLREIERRIVKAEYKTASIPFDPSSLVRMRERRDEFARPIPDVMYEPTSGRMNSRG